ncbi:MAG: hypothetical protein M1435_04170 [Actinobacteria bacterium]|nr:hypothetical protein [Actinomycetota bacterium]
MKKLLATATLVPCIVLSGAGVASAKPQLKPNLGPPITDLEGYGGQPGPPRFYWYPGINAAFKSFMIKRIAAIDAAGGYKTYIGHSGVGYGTFKLHLKRVSCSPYSVSETTPDPHAVDYYCQVIVGIKDVGPIRLQQDILVYRQGHAWKPYGKLYP